MNHKIVGIFGGAFDPVHIGHVKVANQCLIDAKMEKVIIVPTGLSAYEKKLTDEKIRLLMTKLAFNDERFDISDYELRQSKIYNKPSYTINTLRHLTKNSSYSYALIIGSDTLQKLDEWYQWDKILDYCNLFVVPRKISGNDINNLSLSIKNLVTKHKATRLSELSIKRKGCIYFASFPMLPFSSTEIRSLMSQKKSIKKYVSPEIYDFIMQTKCYVAGDKGQEI